MNIPKLDKKVNRKSTELGEQLQQRIAANLQVLMSKLGMPLATLARKAEIPYRTLQNYIYSRNLPDAATLVQLNTKIGVSIDWLLTGEGEMFKDKGEKQTLNDLEYVFVPLVEGSVQAGHDGRVLYDQAVDVYPFKRYWIIKKVGTSQERHKSLVLVRVTGDSMMPTINPGEIVLVDTWESERINIKNGKIYLVRQPDGGISVKRVVLLDKHTNPRLLCQSDNPIYEPFEFDIDPEKTIKWYVLGRIRWVGREVD